MTTAVQGAGAFLDPTKMGITVSGLDSNVAPNGTLWEAHDRVQVTVTYPWKLDIIGVPIWSGTMSTTTQAIIE